MRDFDVPSRDSTFFGPELERTNAYDVFMMGDVARMLKSAGVKGGLLRRLLDDEEFRLVSKGKPAARRRVKDYHIYLT